MKISCCSQRIIEVALLCIVFCLLLAFIAPAAVAQGNPPRLVPYTITTIAGGAASPTAGTTDYTGGTVCGAAWPTDGSHSGTGPNWLTPPYDIVGNGCLATQAALNAARYADPDPFGVIWVVDTGDGMIRKIDPLTNIITQVPGTNTDGSPRGGAFDLAGNYYYEGESKSKSWFVNYISGNVSRFSGPNSGGSGCAGDGGPSTSAQMKNPSTNAIDSFGNTYIVDNKCYAVRRVDPAQNMSTVLGKMGGNGCTLGNGSVASNATDLLLTPYSVAIDPFGNVYVGDNSCYRVIELQVDPATVVNGVGYVTANSIPIVVAGVNQQNPSGFVYPQTCFNNDPCGPAAITPLNPAGVQVDPEGPVTDSSNKQGYNLFIQEGSHIWYYDFATKWVRRIAGGASAPANGNPGTYCSWSTDTVGDNCAAPKSVMGGSYGVDVDSLGNLYVGEAGDGLIRKIWKGVQFTDGSANSLGASFVPQYNSSALVIASATRDASGVSTITTTNSNSLTAGSVVTIGGVSDYSFNGTFVVASVNGAMSFTYTQTGTSASTGATGGYVNPSPASSVNVIRAFFDGADAPATTNPFQTLGNFTLPSTVLLQTGGSPATAPSCQSYTSVTDSSKKGTECVLSVSTAITSPGNVAAPIDISGKAGATTVYPLSTVVNQPSIALDPGIVTQLPYSVGSAGAIAVDGAGNIFVADTVGGRILKNGSVLVGGFTSPQGVAVDGLGNVYIADTGNNVVKKWNALTATVSIVAGGGSPCTFNSWNFRADELGNNCPATQATLNHPTAVVVDALMNLYILDQGNAQIRRVDPKSKAITLVAGGGSMANLATDIPDCNSNPNHPRCVTLHSPIAMAVGVPGQVWVLEGGSNPDILFINLLSFPATINKVGRGSTKYASPAGLAVDAGGNLYYTDASLQTVGMINAAQTDVDQLVLGIVGNSGASTLTSGTLATDVTLNNPGAIAVDPNGNLYVFDSNAGRILKVDRSQTIVDFGTINLGVPTPGPDVTVTNVGQQAFQVQQLTVSGFPNDFSIGNNVGILLPCSTDPLASGQSCQLQAQAQLVDSGALSAQISLAGNALNAPAVQLAAAGKTSTATTTQLSFNPALHAIGDTADWVAQVTPSGCGGEVTFSVDGQPFISVGPDSATGTYHTPFKWKNGSGAVADPFLETCGLMNLEARYVDPTGTCSSSQASQAIVLPGAATTTTVTASSDPTKTGTTSLTINQYQFFYLTAAITSSASGTPTGTVQYWISGPGGDRLLSAAGIMIEGKTAPELPASAEQLNGSGQAVYSTQWLPPGTYQIYARYLGDCAFNPSDSKSVLITLTVVKVPWDFSLTPGIQNAVTSGAQGFWGSAIFTLKGINYPGALTSSQSATVNFTCSGNPVYSTCTFDQDPVTMARNYNYGNSPAQFPCSDAFDANPTCKVTLFLVTNLPPIARSAPRGHMPLLAALALMCPGLFLVGGGCVSGKSTRRKLFFLAAVVLLTGALLVLSGCGGSFHKVKAITPAGTYNITVTATMTLPDGELITNADGSTSACSVAKGNCKVVHTSVVPMTVGGN